MIIAKTTKDKKYHIAFTVRKELTDDFLNHRTKKQTVKASVDKQEKTIEIIDFLAQPFDGLPLLNMLLRTGTDFEADTIQKGLVKRYGHAIKSQLIYIISYRIVK